jgi:phosphohistidine phosphatase
MKRLYILRHARASSSYEKWNDIDRPLKPSGLLDAYLLGGLLKEKALEVDLIAVSSAARALQTASAVARAAALPLECLRVSQELYLPNDGETLAYLRRLPNEVTAIMVVGHNPDLSYLCEQLQRDGCPELPTCGFAAFSSTASSWSELDHTNTQMEYHIFPL